MNVEKMELWRMRIAEQKESGQRIHEWCTSNKLSRHAYYYWSKKIADYDIQHGKRNEQVTFAEISYNELGRNSSGNTCPASLCIQWNDLTLTVSDTRTTEPAAYLIKTMRQSC